MLPHGATYGQRLLNLCYSRNGRPPSFLLRLVHLSLLIALRWVQLIGLQMSQSRALVTLDRVLRISQLVNQLVFLLDGR